MHVDYSYSWHVYNGCDDMNQQDEECEGVVGVLDGNCLVFERYASPPKLSPNEEL